MRSASEASPFQQIAIAGLGLIGGSIALAVRERWPAARVTAVDRPAVLAHAMGSGAIDRACASVALVGGADLIVLAAPVRQNIELLGQIEAGMSGPVVVTDVGGTKQDIVTAARALPASITFVGGHPLGGAERGGFGFARPDLFAGRPWIFTPDGEAAAHAVGRLSTFVAGLGAKPTTLDAAGHDRLMAFLSHLPQLTASALMEVAGSAAGEKGLTLGGQGLVDTTRLASSPASVWKDICATNADSIARALDLLIARLTDIRASLQDGSTVDRLFEDAARWRAELMKGRE
jgi:prephenate dehydrogenase